MRGCESKHSVVILFGIAKIILVLYLDYIYIYLKYYPFNKYKYNYIRNNLLKKIIIF